MIAEAGLAADNTQGYFVKSDGRLVAVDLRTGEIGWTAEFGGQPVSEILLSSDSVIVASRATGAATAQHVVLRSFTKSTGLVNWHAELAPSDRFYLEKFEQGLLAVADSGEIRLVNQVDGRTTWKVAAAKRLVAIPQIADGRLLLAASPKKLEEFSLSNGTLNWTAEVKTVPFIISLAGGNASVYSDDKGNVFSVDQKGDTKWKFRAGGKVVYVKAVGDNILLSSSDNFIYFMSADYGNLLWKRRLPGRIASGGLIGEELAAFTVVGDRSAYVIELKEGKVIDKITVDDEDAFLLTPIRANGIYLLAATAKGLSAFASVCGNEKSGERAPLS